MSDNYLPITEEDLKHAEHLLNSSEEWQRDGMEEKPCIVKYKVFDAEYHLIGAAEMQFYDADILMLDLILFNELKEKGFVDKSLVWDFLIIDHETENEIIFRSSVNNHIWVRVVVDNDCVDTKELTS